MHTAVVSMLTKSSIYHVSTFHPQYSKVYTLHSYHSHSSFGRVKGHGIKCSSGEGMGDQGNSRMPWGIGNKALTISRMSSCRPTSLPSQTVPMASDIAAAAGVAAVSTTEVVATAKAQGVNVVADEDFGTSMDHVTKPALRGSQETGRPALYAYDPAYTGGSVTERSAPATTATLSTEGKPSSVSASSLDCYGGDNGGRLPSEHSFRLPSR